MENAHRPRLLALLLGILLLFIAGFMYWRMNRPTLETPPPAPVAPVVPVTPSPAPAVPAPLPPAPPIAKPKPAPPKPAPQKPTPKTMPVVTPHPPLPVPTRPVSPPTTLPPPPPAPTEWQGTDTSVTHSGQVVIKNDRQWIQFWSEHHPHEPAPEVNFAQHMVIGVFAGGRPADGFSIQMVTIRPTAKELRVEYREQIPPPGTVAINVTVYPYHLKAIPRTPLPVKFVRVNS